MKWPTNWLYNTQIPFTTWNWDEIKVESKQNQYFGKYVWTGIEKFKNWVQGGIDQDRTVSSTAFNQFFFFGWKTKISRLWKFFFSQGWWYDVNRLHWPSKLKDKCTTCIYVSYSAPQRPLACTSVSNFAYWGIFVRCWISTQKIYRKYCRKLRKCCWITPKHRHKEN